MSRRRSSSTISAKYKEEESDSNSPATATEPPVPQVQIVMRRSGKPARTVDVLQKIKVQQLLSLVQKQFYLFGSQQVLFCEGKRLPTAASEKQDFINFQKHSILHVHSSEHFSRQHIHITLVFLNQQCVKYRDMKIATPSREIILATLDNALMCEIEPIEKYVFYQSGRELNLGRTFKDEAVEDESIILVLPSNMAAEDARKIQLREIQIVDMKNRLMKKVSLDIQQTEDECPDFKKKFKCNTYKSMILPETKEIIWQEEAGIWEVKELPKKISLKKKKTKSKKLSVVYEPETSSSSSLNSSSESGGKQNPETSAKTRQILKLKPPTIFIEEFDQEIESQPQRQRSDQNQDFSTFSTDDNNKFFVGYLAESTDSTCQYSPPESEMKDQYWP